MPLACAFVAGRPTDADRIDNQLVAAYVDLMDEYDILQLLSSCASDAIGHSFAGVLAASASVCRTRLWRMSVRVLG